MESPRTKSVRRGSFMSDRQIGRAAARRELMEFTLSTGETIQGYVGGADDFHWLVVRPAGYSVAQILVHKSCPVVRFTGLTLNQEDRDSQEAVEGVCAAFWNYCTKKYTGTNPTTAQEQP